MRCPASFHKMHFPNILQTQKRTKQNQRPRSGNIFIMFITSFVYATTCAILFCSAAIRHISQISQFAFAQRILKVMTQNTNIKRRIFAMCALLLVRHNAACFASLAVGSRNTKQIQTECNYLRSVAFAGNKSSYLYEYGKTRLIHFRSFSAALVSKWHDL